MRLPHWIVRRTLACLRCLREHSILSHYLLSMLLREKKKLQDELNQLSRNCLKDVESRSTLYKLIYQGDHFPFPLNSRSIPFSLGILRLYEMASPLVLNHLTFKIQRRSTQSLMPSTLQLCKHKWMFINLPNLLPGKTRQVTKGRKGWRKARWRNLQRRAARPVRTKKMSSGHKGRRENMGRWPTLVLIFLMKTSLTRGVTAPAKLGLDIGNFQRNQQ